MTNQKLIFLCGFMGCGKTTHGKKLAKVFSCRFIDLDKEIETLTKLTVSELFALKGENEFRNIETECLKDVVANTKSAVISLGGGTPCFNNNIELIKHNGLLVYIKMDSKSLYKRLKQASYQRPLLKGKTEKELLDYITDLLLYREQFYNQADISINGLNLNDTLLKQSIDAYYSSTCG